MRTKKTTLELFHEKYIVDPVTGCWQWQAGTCGRGYSKIGYTRPDGTRRTVGAYKWIMEQIHGPIAPGYEPDHLCRNKLCVNPDHMEIVTRAENNRRRVAAYRENGKEMHWKLRASGKCREGHEMTPENTIDKKDGTRTCRTCRQKFQRKWLAAKKSKLDRAA
jgi:hypothetical protein